MNIIKSTNLIWLLLIWLLFARCNDDNIETGIEQIDKEYKFLRKQTFKYNNDSTYTHVDLYYTGNDNDSVYLIGFKEKDGYTIRARGWDYKVGRIGDWIYERIYDDKKVVVDSIVNSVIYCNKSLINTIKKFKNNKLDRYQGYSYKIDMKENVFVGDTLYINLNYVFDTIVFEKLAREFYLFNPHSVEDYCDATKNIVDSFPIINNSTKMRFLMDSKGKTRFLGYYYLVRRKSKNDSLKELMKVFTEINFEVK